MDGGLSMYQEFHSKWIDTHGNRNNDCLLFLALLNHPSHTRIGTAMGCLIVSLVLSHTLDTPWADNALVSHVILHVKKDYVQLIDS